MNSRFLIVAAETPGHVDAARRLFEEYQRSLGFSLCFQGFDRELASLPGAYAPPEGRLLIAVPDPLGEAVGCVGVRRLGPGVCEMKRLYVRPAAQGAGLGRGLALRAVTEARRAGYSTMLLDTVPDRMAAAVSLYRALGFRDAEDYNRSPLAGIAHMGLDLRGAPEVRVETVGSPRALATARALLEEYAEYRADLVGPSDAFAGELRELPGVYGPPGGAILVATFAGRPAGVVTLRPTTSADSAETRRLFVRPALRRLGVARALVVSVMAEAAARGYARLRLVTLPELEAAVALYEALGFERVAPFRESTRSDAVFMESGLRG